MKHTDFYPTQPLYVVTSSSEYNFIPKFEEHEVREIKISMINSDNEIDVNINNVIQYRGTIDNLELYSNNNRNTYYFINKEEAFHFYEKCKDKYITLIEEEHKKQLGFLKTVEDQFSNVVNKYKLK